MSWYLQNDLLIRKKKRISMTILAVLLPTAIVLSRLVRRTSTQVLPLFLLPSFCLTRIGVLGIGERNGITPL